MSRPRAGPGGEREERQHKVLRLAGQPEEGQQQLPGSSRAAAQTQGGNGLRQHPL